MPCCSHPRRNASLLNSAPLSKNNDFGFPLIGQSASTPSRSSQGRLSPAAWARHNPTDTADGGSKVMTIPTSVRLYTSIATVKYGRPIDRRSRSSTMTTSMTVWSICTCSRIEPITGTSPPAACNGLTASAPSLRRPTSTGLSIEMRRATVFLVGAFNPRAAQAQAISRWIAATLRF